MHQYFFMKKSLLTVFCIFLLGKINAQHESAFSQYHMNHFLVNPAAAGHSNFHTIFTHLRFQWTGLPNAPKTGIFSYQAPMGRIGLGGTIFSDRVASLKRFGANFSYAYRSRIRDSHLSIGLGGHYQRFFLDRSAVDGLEHEDDLTVYEAMDGLNVYDANLGAYFYNEKMYVGFSVPNIIQARLSTIGTNLSTVSQLSRQYIFIAGYKYLPAKSFFSVEPSVMMRKVQSLPFQMLLTMKFGMMNERFFTSFTYGTTDVVTFSLGAQILPEAKFAYSYDYAVGDLYRYTRGSHELSVIWEFGKPDMKKPIKSNRYKH